MQERYNTVPSRSGTCRLLLARRPLIHLNLAQAQHFFGTDGRVALEYSDFHICRSSKFTFSLL